MRWLYLQLVFWVALGLAGIVALLLLGGGDWTPVLAVFFALGLMVVVLRVINRKSHE